jgi:hypothetical protein
LTAASELPHHPTLSKPFLSNTLTDLTRQAGEMVQKERASLWRIKHLLTRISGDDTWIPCEIVESENDFKFFVDEPFQQRGNQVGRIMLKEDADGVSTETISEEEGPLIADDNQSKHKGSGEFSGDGDSAITSNGNITSFNKQDSAALEEPSDDPAGEGHHPPADGAMDLDTGAEPAQTEKNRENQPALEAGERDPEVGEGEDLPAPHRMRTRAQAQAASDSNTSRARSGTPDSNMDSFIHPFFLAPQKSFPDRDLGLPQHEAEETRRLLQLYIQKQEEVCRGAQRVYDGLLKADRYRHLVMKWSKAEAHVGVNRDMSDGEDWYDKEEWGLDEDLKKGQDEEEEDAATTAKKTRTRRQ